MVAFWRLAVSSDGIVEECLKVETGATATTTTTQTQSQSGAQQVIDMPASRGVAE